MSTVTESIYDGSSVVPMADVSHIEGRPTGFMVVMKYSTYNTEFDDYNNAVFFGKEEGEKFKAAWCRYRHELESATLKDLRPVEAQ